MSKIKSSSNFANHVTTTTSRIRIFKACSIKWWILTWWIKIWLILNNLLKCSQCLCLISSLSAIHQTKCNYLQIKCSQWNNSSLQPPLYLRHKILMDNHSLHLKILWLPKNYLSNNKTFSKCNWLSSSSFINICSKCNTIRCSNSRNNKSKHLKINNNKIIIMRKIKI